MLDLFTLRERFNREQIMLCFNGPISRSLIEEIGNALRDYLTADHAAPSAAMDVFSVYIEMTQNIRHYTREQGWGGRNSATVIVSGMHRAVVVAAGNLVEVADGERLIRASKTCARWTGATQGRHKEQLRRPRDAVVTSGAGLGLIDIARKAVTFQAIGTRSMAGPLSACAP